MNSNIPYSGFFDGENFHKFHELIAICENFTLEAFTLDINLQWCCLSVSKLTNV